MSSRKLQRDPHFAGPVPQWGFSKGFDKYAPLGPAIVSTALIPDPTTMHLETIVDGEMRQTAGIDDLVFGVAFLVSYLSQGTTLQKGSVIMTGTPGGVGISGKSEPRYLYPGSKVDVRIKGVGTLRNTIEFE